jgi:cytochrome c-type biogenesis protein
MGWSMKVPAVALILGVVGVAAFAWESARSTGGETVPAGDGPCAAMTEACGAHPPKGHAAAPRVEGRPRLLVFTSHSCPACKRMEPIVESAVTACGGAHDVERVDFDDDAGEALAATYGVKLLPSFLSIDSTGSEVARLTGVQPRERLERALEEVRGVRCASIERPANERPM